MILYSGEFDLTLDKKDVDRFLLCDYESAECTEEITLLLAGH